MIITFFFIITKKVKETSLSPKKIISNFFLPFIYFPSLIGMALMILLFFYSCTFSSLVKMALKRHMLDKEMALLINLISLTSASS